MANLRGLTFTGGHNKQIADADNMILGAGITTSGAGDFTLQLPNQTAANVAATGLVFGTGSGGPTTTSSPGGDGGGLTISLGTGAAASTTSGGNAGRGGGYALTTGLGGNATAVNPGGHGGDITITGNTGGAGSAAQAAGRGASITIQANGAGAANGGAGGAGGVIVLDTGLRTGSGTHSHIDIGVTNTEVVNLGRTGATLNVATKLAAVLDASSTITTASGNLGIDAVGNLNIGAGSTGTINIGNGTASINFNGTVSGITVNFTNVTSDLTFNPGAARHVKMLQAATDTAGQDLYIQGGDAGPTSASNGQVAGVLYILAGKSGDGNNTSLTAADGSQTYITGSTGGDNQGFGGTSGHGGRLTVQAGKSGGAVTGFNGNNGGDLYLLGGDVGSTDPGRNGTTGNIVMDCVNGPNGNGGITIGFGHASSVSIGNSASVVTFVGDVRQNSGPVRMTPDFGYIFASSGSFLFDAQTLRLGDQFATSISFGQQGQTHANLNGAIAFPPWTTSPLSADVNDYNPSFNTFNRWSTTGSPQTVTGLVAGHDGEWRRIINVGSANITLTNQDSSSSSANRWLTTTGSNIVIAPNQMVDAVYDNTTGAWRVSLLP